MSSELERLLRQARRTLPGPSSAATRQARELALARRRRGLGRRSTVALGAALLVAVGLGAGLGALITPSGTAASGPHGVGFLPERGWNVLQNGGDGTPARPAAAIAANVPLHASDDPEGLPYATLQALPPDGVVILAGFVERGDPILDEGFPQRALPLQVRAAVPFGVQVRPGRPLGQYQLRVGVDDYNVDVSFYFGVRPPSGRLLQEAQRQLDRLVVREAPESRAAPRATQGAAAAPSRVIDRTFLCTNEALGGTRKLRASAQRGFREAGRWKWLASAGVGNRGAELVQLPPNNKGLVGTSDTSWGVRIVAGSGTPPSSEQGGGRPSILISTRGCTPAPRRIPLLRTGLAGGDAGYFGDDYECVAPRRVLVRFRGVFRGAASLRLQQGPLKTFRAQGDVREASFVVRTESGKPLAFGSVLASGKARLFTASGCVAD